MDATKNIFVNFGETETIEEGPLMGPAEENVDEENDEDDDGNVKCDDEDVNDDEDDEKYSEDGDGDNGPVGGVESGAFATERLALRLVPCRISRQRNISAPMPCMPPHLQTKPIHFSR